MLRKRIFLRTRSFRIVVFFFAQVVLAQHEPILMQSSNQGISAQLSVPPFQRGPFADASLRDEISRPISFRGSPADRVYRLDLGHFGLTSSVGFYADLQGVLQDGMAVQAQSFDANSILDEPPLYSSGGFFAQGTALADVNGDGKPDLIVAHWCRRPKSGCHPGAVAVMLGNGDGTYQRARVFNSGGYNAVAVAAADVNGDGKLDILLANFYKSSDFSGGSLGVLLGNGDGTFQRAMTYPLNGRYPVSIVVADLNDDGNSDVAIANQCLTGDANVCSGGATGGVDVILGNGDGSFQPPQSYSSGGIWATSLRVLDINKDSIPDVIVSSTCSGTLSNCGSGVIGVLLGNGDGTLQSAFTFNSGGLSPDSFALADLNGDRNLDLVASNSCSIGDCTVPALGVLLGHGDGTFGAPAILESLGGEVALADMNGDGTPDLLLSNGELLVMPGKGDGTFAPSRNYSLGDAGGTIVVSDVNGDGHSDVVSVSSCLTAYVCNTGGVKTLLGNGDGTLAAPRNLGLPPNAYLQTIATADINGDGKLDLVVSATIIGQGTSLQVLTGKGDGTFRSAASNDLGSFSVSSSAIADVNGDGLLDILVAGGGSVGVLLANGNGTFQSLTTYDSGGVNASSIAVADLNRDGKLDLIVANGCSSDPYCGLDSSTGTVGVLLGNGDGTFQAVVTYSSGGLYANSLAVADINRDGKLDVVVLNQCVPATSCRSGDGVVGVLLGNGDGTLQAAQTFDSAGFSSASLAVADINRDGKLDLAVVNSCTSSDQCSDVTTARGVLAIFLGNGDGTFSAPIAIQALSWMGGPIAIADLNGDGKLDLAVGNGALLFVGKGNGAFRLPVDLGANGPIAVGDFNRDGKPDLAVGDTILLNRAPSRAK
jgi:hypothetical protein